MLTVDNLNISHGDKTLLRPLCFEVEAGGTLVIMGETGAGKSLIAQAVMGVLPSQLKATGSIYVNGQHMDGGNLRQRQFLWGRSLVMLPQEPWHALDPLMSAYQQVFESHKYVKGVSSTTARQLTMEDFETLQLEQAMHKRPGELSGGMSQRVAFASAMAGGGNLVIADEPTKGLDASARSITIDLLKKVPAQGGALIVITHDIQVAQSAGGQLLVLKDGDLVEHGNTVEVLAQPTHAYTGALVAASPIHWPKKALVDTGSALLRADNLVVGRENRALNSAMTLTIGVGERIAIEGPSGIGKTTLLDTFAGLIKPVSGRIIHEQKLGATDIQKIYQDPPSAFAPHVTLRKSLGDVAKLHKVPWAEVEVLLDKLSVSDALLDRLPASVSGGELQRIAIARALIVKPKLLLADEPTSRLDPITQQQTMKMLDEVAQQTDTAIVLVTHDNAMASKWAGDTLSFY